MHRTIKRKPDSEQTQVKEQIEIKLFRNKDNISQSEAVISLIIHNYTIFNRIICAYCNFFIFFVKMEDLRVFLTPHTLKKNSIEEKKNHIIFA